MYFRGINKIIKINKEYLYDTIATGNGYIVYLSHFEDVETYKI